MSKSSRRFPFAHPLSHLLRLILAAAMMMISGRVVRAQSGGITEGSRVQISAAGAKRVTGIVRSVTADSTTLYVDGSGGIRRFAQKDITSLRMSMGRSSSEGAKKGAMWGGAIGAAFGVAIVALVELDPNANNKNGLFAYAAQSALGGIIWGAGIGAFTKAEKWESVPVHAGMSASSGGIGLSFAFSPSFLH